MPGRVRDWPQAHPKNGTEFRNILIFCSLFEEDSFWVLYEKMHGIEEGEADGDDDDGDDFQAMQMSRLMERNSVMRISTTMVPKKTKRERKQKRRKKKKMLILMTIVMTTGFYHTLLMCSFEQALPASEKDLLPQPLLKALGHNPNAQEAHDDTNVDGCR